MKPIIVESWGSEGWGTYTFDGADLVVSGGVSEGVLAPGFVDVHIHGAFGMDFMSASTEALVELADQLAEVGYEAFLPTTVTADLGDVLAAVDRFPQHEMMPGFHLEGPFISPVYPGAQPLSKILGVPEMGSSWEEVFEHPGLKYITIAPELEGALSLIERLAKRGVVVSVGHTNATYEEAVAGFDSGAKHATHTFNAMRPFHHREAGTVGAVLLDERVSAELIYDRHHVSREAAGLLLKCKGLDQVIGVSDCTMAHGQSAGSTVEMWGHKGVVGEKEVRLAGTDTLAGSASTLLDCFRNLAEDFGAEAAVRLCSVNPRKALGMTGAPRKYALFSAGLELKEVFSTHN